MVRFSKSIIFPKTKQWFEFVLRDNIDEIFIFRILIGIHCDAWKTSSNIHFYLETS